MFLVTAKIRNIHDYHIRIQHGTPPLPSAVDITNTIKYFHQVLLGKHLGPVHKLRYPCFQDF